MDNSRSSQPSSRAPAPPHAYGGRVNAQAELALPLTEGDTFIVDGNAIIKKITSFPRSVPVFLFFTGTCTLTHSAAFPQAGGVSQLVSANDMVFVVPVGDGAWRAAPVMYSATISAAAAKLPGLGGALINGRIDASVAGNALTVAVKTLAGNDPSSADPVYISFRTASVASSDPVLRAITAAFSHTVTGTFGTTANIPFKLYATVHDSNGILRLGLINCVLTNPIGIVNLDESALVSTTAGSGNSAGVFYTATDSISSRSFRVLGNVQYNSGLATPGTYNSAPTVTQVDHPGLKRPGDYGGMVSTTYTANTNLTATIPADDTIPQSGEGTQILSKAIVVQPGNIARIWCQGWGVNNAAEDSIFALFSDASGANALYAGNFHAAALNTNFQGFGFFYDYVSPNPASTTYSLRVGPSNTGVMRLNGNAAARRYGGSSAAIMRIDEIQG